MSKSFGMESAQGIDEPSFGWTASGVGQNRLTIRDRRSRNQGKGLGGQDGRLDPLADDVAAVPRLTISIGEKLARSEGQ